MPIFHVTRPREAQSSGRPVFVMMAAIIANLCELGQIVVLALPPISVVGLAFTIVAADLLIAGSSLGWILMMLWAISAISAPFLFDASVWFAMGGVLVAGLLATKAARTFCLSAETVFHPVAAEREFASGLPGFFFKVDNAVAGRTRNWFERHSFWLRRRNVVCVLLGVIVVLLPLSGVLARLDRKSGHGDPLVDVAYHFVSVCSAFAQIAFILMLFWMLRGFVRSKA